MSKKKMHPKTSELIRIMNDAQTAGEEDISKFKRLLNSSMHSQNGIFSSIRRHLIGCG
jgi:hypothetical protein